jgi:Holin of 3TMs, for gene-transfer release
MSIWDTVAAPIISIINKVVPDKAAAASAIAQLNQMQLQGQLQDELTQLQAVTTNQSAVDQSEATNANVLVSGWRPAIGWVCATALGYQYLLKPLALAGLSIARVTPMPVLPGLDDGLWQLMFGMLGLGTLHSFDKTKGTVVTKFGSGK